MVTKSSEHFYIHTNDFMTKLVDFDVVKLSFQVTKLPPMEDIRPQVTEATNKEVIYLNYLQQLAWCLLAGNVCRDRVHFRNVHYPLDMKNLETF